MPQDFSSLSTAGQARRLRGVARAALSKFGRPLERLALIQHWENTTFRVGSGSEQCLLRVHRPGYQSASEIGSEMEWLRALRHDTTLAVPEPVATTRGDWVAPVEAAGVPEARCCTLLRWVPGRFVWPVRAAHVEALGEAAATLHEHADAWKPPAGFTRRRWDFDGLLGASAGFGAGESAWEVLPAHRGLLERAAEQIRAAMNELGEAPGSWGLIHGDLHFRNVLFAGSPPRARVIDFDDCGWGHRVYELAVTVDSVPRNDEAAHRESFLRGYRRRRAFPDDDLRFLPVFIAARNVSLGVWVADRARTHPTFRDKMPTWLDSIASNVRHNLGIE